MCVPGSKSTGSWNIFAIRIYLIFYFFIAESTKKVYIQIKIYKNQITYLKNKLSQARQEKLGG